MKDLKIIVDDKTSKVFPERRILGNKGENKQCEIIFEFKNNFINGVGYLEVQYPNNKKEMILLEKENNTYKLIILSSLLQQVGELYMCLRITERTEDLPPIFKSNVFEVEVLDSINTVIEEPEEYATWIDTANTKINEIDNKLIEVDESEQERQLNEEKRKELYTEIFNKKDSIDEAVAKVDEFALKSELPTKLSELENDNNTVTDDNYTHTDNNYTNEEKEKLASLNNYDDSVINEKITNLENNKADKTSIPTNISQLQNDSNYATESFVEQEIANFDFIKIVTELPTTGLANRTYFLPKSGTDNDLYDEYMWVNGAWELVGTKQIEVDLTDYVRKNSTEITNKQLLSNLSQTINESTTQYPSNNAVKNYVQNEIGNIGHIYGIRRKITNNTSTVWERLEDNVGKIANATKNGGAVQNDFDNLAPWSEIQTCNYDITSKKVKAWIGDANFAFDGSNGDVYTYFPEVYIKAYQKDDYDYIFVADYAKSGYTKYDSFYIARYTNGLVDGKLRSYSGLLPAYNKNISQFRTLARELGNEFSLLDYRYFVIQTLYLVEYADYNSQAKLGNGVISKSWDNTCKAELSGGCDSLGMKSGCLINDNLHSMIYRGVENIYGNMWQFVDGMNIKERIVYLCKNPSEYASDKFDGSYKAIGYTNCNTAGYVSKLGYDPDEPLARFPVEVGAGSGSGTSDYYYQNTGNRIALVGGNFSGGARCGFWSWTFSDASSFANVNFGCRVLINQETLNNTVSNTETILQEINGGV